MIEILTFRLLEGADEAAFREADRRVQVEFAYAQPGLVRRTTARGDDGEWVVIDIWASSEAAEACDERWGGDDVTQGFMSFVDAGSARSSRYSTLE